MSTAELPIEHGQLMTFGERLHLARSRSRKSVQQFADTIGMHRNNIPRWERAETQPNYRLAGKYVEALGNTTLEWLMFEIGPWPTSIDGPPPDDYPGSEIADRYRTLRTGNTQRVGHSTHVRLSEAA